MKIEVHKPLSILFLAAALAACGGGGGGSPAPAPEAPPPASPPAPAFAPTQFTVYRNTQPAAVAGAGAVSAGPTLSLGAGNQTLLTLNPALTVVQPSVNPEFPLGAAGYYLMTRRDGALLMLCQTSSSLNLGRNTTGLYVAVATASGTAATQASLVTSPTELAGRSFYQMRDCAYVDTTGATQGQNAAATTATFKLTVDSVGNLSGSDGGLVPAATFAAQLGGAARALVGIGFVAADVYLTAYKFTVNGQAQYFMVERRSSPTASANTVSLWLPN